MPVNKNFVVKNGLEVGGNSLFVNSATDRVGIGTTNPITALHISNGSSGINTALYVADVDFVTLSGQNTSPGINAIVAGTADLQRGVYKGTRSRGTLSSPTVPLNNDDVVSLVGAIYDGSTNQSTAAIHMEVDGAVSAGVAPQRITFWTGIGTNRLERVRLSSSGNFGIGTTTPVGQLQVSSGPVIVGSGSSTGTVSQPLQVTGGAYVSGNLGVGVTNPATQLHIQSTAPTIRFNETDATADNKNWNVTTWNQEFYWQGLNDAGTGGNNLFAMTRSGNQIQSFEARNAGLTWFDIDNANQRVGIGTSIPAAQLHIQSNQPIIRFLENDASLNNKNWNVNVWNQEFYWQALNDVGIGGSSLFAITRSGNEIQAFDGRNAGITWFKVDNNTQRVGIGTSIPTSALTVTGSGTSTSQLYVTGVSTFIGNVAINTTNPTSALTVQGDGRFTGVVTATAFKSGSTTLDDGELNLSGNTFFGNILLSGRDLWFTPESDGILNFGDFIFYRRDSFGSFTEVSRIFGATGGATFKGTTRLAGISTFTSTGISILTNLNSTGIITASSFSGAGVTVTGTTFTNQLSVSGVSTFSGNIGVGTTNPATQLHLQSTQPTIRFTETDVAANNKNWNVTVWNREFYWQAINDVGIGGSSLFAITRSGNEIQTFEGRNAGVTWFDIDNNTQTVGIGTTTPTSKLSVVGGDISVGVSTAQGLILTSPNGTRYRLFVENDGTLKTVAV